MPFLWPALEKLLPNYPDVHVELVIELGFTDIVAERFDAGVRLGEFDRQGHGRRAHWAGLAHGGRGVASVLRGESKTANAAGSGSA